MSVSTATSSQNLAKEYGSNLNNDYGSKHEIAVSETEHAPLKPLSANGAQLQVNWNWSKWRNVVTDASTGKTLYVQHFGLRKPNMRFNGPDDKTELATGTINSFHISGECNIAGRTIELKPLSRLQTEYNYLSYAFAHPSDPTTPIAISWTGRFSKKTWDFVCLDATSQMPIAQFSANVWKLVEVGNIFFDKSAEQLSDAQRDEIVMTGMTIFYIMVTRMNNPLNLLGAAFAKPGKVDAGNGEVELEDRKSK